MNVSKMNYMMLLLYNTTTHKVSRPLTCKSAGECKTKYYRDNNGSDLGLLTAYPSIKVH